MLQPGGGATPTLYLVCPLILATLAEFDREMIVEGTLEGLASARAPRTSPARRWGAPRGRRTSRWPSHGWPTQWWRAAAWTTTRRCRGPRSRGTCPTGTHRKALVSATVCNRADHQDAMRRWTAEMAGTPEIGFAQVPASAP